MLGLSFLCPLARDRKPLPGFFFLFAPIDISGLPSSPTSSLGYMMKKENPGNSSLCCFLCPKIPNQSPFFLPFLQSSYICFTYNFHSFYFLDLARSLTLANKIAKMIYASSKMKLTEQSSNYTTAFFFFFFLVPWEGNIYVGTAATLIHATVMNEKETFFLVVSWELGLFVITSKSSKTIMSMLNGWHFHIHKLSL